VSLDAIQTALVAWVIALTGVEAPFVGFKDDARANVVTKGRSIDLSWVSDVGLGRGELRYERDDSAVAPDPDMTPIQVGNALMVLQISIETWDQRATANAHYLARRLRDRVRLPGSSAALLAANLGFAGIGTVLSADNNSDGRMVSKRVLEVRLNAATLERGDSTDQTGSIESVEVSSEYITVGEDPIATPLQVTNEVIP
jgi:hypothetical protein